MAIKESEVQKWVKDELLKIWPDTYIFKAQAGQYTSRKGIPDWIACIEGLFVAIEVKTAAGTLTKLQSYEITKIAGAKGLAYVIYGKDDEMMALIAKDINDGLRILRGDEAI